MGTCPSWSFKCDRGNSLLTVYRYLLGPLENNTYLLVDEDSSEAALIDPTFESEFLLAEIALKGWYVRYILNTHAHFDHVVGNAHFVESLQVPLALHRADLFILDALVEQGLRFGFPLQPSPQPTLWLEEGQILYLGKNAIQVVHTPGHSPGSVSFLFEGGAIVGDVLFAGSIGRTDLPSGSLQTLLHSIRTQLLPLPDDTIVYPGHNELTTIGEERRSNPYIQGL